METGVVVFGMSATFCPSMKKAKMSLMLFTYSLYSSEANT